MVPTTPGFLYASGASFLQNESSFVAEEKNNQKERFGAKRLFGNPAPYSLSIYPHQPTHPQPRSRKAVAYHTHYTNPSRISALTFISQPRSIVLLLLIFSNEEKITIAGDKTTSFG